MQGSELSREVIGSAIEVHQALGPGKREPAYERALAHELARRGLAHEVQRPVLVIYKGISIECGYRLDVLACDSLVVEIKAVEVVHPLHRAQVLTYLKLGGWRFGLLLNFNVAVLKNGIERLAMGYDERHAPTTETRQTQRTAEPFFPEWKLTCGDSTADASATEVTAAAAEVHAELGPGLLASAYRACLCYELQQRGVPFERPVLPLKYKGLALGETVQIDLLVGECVVVKVIAKQALQSLDHAEMLSQLHLGGWPLGLVLNFHTLHLCDGLSRVVCTQSN
jgi:GxxExxY protein